MVVQLVILLMNTMLLLASAVTECSRAQSLFQLDSSVSPQMQNRIDEWLVRIEKVKTGREMLQLIASAAHPVYLEHSHHSLETAGKTLIPLTTRAFNGSGVWARIQFALDMPDEGSHRLFDCAGQTIDWPAIVNFFHELSHAGHAVQGSLIYNIEYQAIVDENQFRSELAQVEPISASQRCYRTADESLRDFYP